jgi:hypothetical protein
MNNLPLLMLLGVGSAMSNAHADDAAATAILRSGCTQDAQRLCAGIQPGGGRMLACLRDHKDSLSDQCKQAAQKAAATSGGNAPPAPASTPAPTAPPSASVTTPSAPAASASASYLRLKKAQIMLIMSLEPNAKPQPEVEMLIPAGWDMKGGLIPTAGLKSGCFGDSFPIGIDAEAPDGIQAFQKSAEYSWQYSDDPQELQKLNDPNRRAHGGNGKVCPVGKPLTAEQAFRQNVLPSLPSGTKLISIDPYPELVEIVRQQLGIGPQDDNRARVDAIRAHIEFEGKNNKSIEGKTMEGWLTCAVVTRTFPLGRAHFYDMRALDQMSLVAPKGQLAGNEKLFRVMISSIKFMPDFIASTNKAIAGFYQTQAKKEAAIDRINANLQTDIMQAYQHISDNAARASRQGFLEADQGIRGVQTFRDPSTGHTMELSDQYGRAWLNGADQYVMSDDPNFNPNAHLSGNWNELQAVRPSP